MASISWKNPYVLGGAGLLLVVLVVARSGGSSNAGAMGLQSQAIATNANVQLAGIGAGLDARAMETASLIDLSRMSLISTIAGEAFETSRYMTDVSLQRYAIAEATSLNRYNADAALKAISINADTARYQIDAEKLVSLTGLSMTPQLMEISGRTQENILRIQGANELAIRQQDANTIGAIQMRQRTMQTDQQQASLNSQLLGIGGSLLGRVVGTGSGGGLLGMLGL